MTLYMAISRQEGFYVEGSRAARNNNPGNLEYGPFTKTQGATGGDPRFAIFPTPEMGFAALHNLFLTEPYRGLTLEQALNRFAPPVENDTRNYLANVCVWTGANPETPLANLVTEAA